MKTIVWDVDDVLNELMRNWYEHYWLPDHPKCKIGYDNISENPPCRLLDISKSDYLDSLDRFRVSEKADSMKPVHSLVEWFEKNGSNFYHIALTATPIRSAPISAAWVIRHFGNWIRSFHFVPSIRPNDLLSQYHNSKGDFLRWWGKADIFVDDNPDNLVAAQALGIKTVCMPQPWNDCRLTLAETLEALTILSDQ